MIKTPYFGVKLIGTNNIIGAARFYTTEDPQYFRLERRMEIGRPSFSGMLPDVSSLDVMAFSSPRSPQPVLQWSLPYVDKWVIVETRDYGSCEVLTFKVPSNADGRLTLDFNANDSTIQGLPEPKESDINVRRS